MARKREIIPDTPEEMESLRKRTYRELDSPTGRVSVSQAIRGLGRVVRYGVGGAKQMFTNRSRTRRSR